MKPSTTILLGIILTFGNASPIRKAERPFDARAVSVTNTQFDNFDYFAQFAAAAYCTNNDNQTAGPISCINNACPRVSASNAVTVLEFDTGDLTDANVYGFVAVDPSRSQIVVSFRGSDSVRNWIADVEIELVNTSICSSCMVHYGFNQAWSERQSAVVAAVSSAIATNPSYRLVITGHSLGAAVATIAGAYFRSSGINCDIYTYGSPRVGDSNFANYVSSTSQGTVYRITHLNDPVPHLPPGGILAPLTGYYHTSAEYWLSNGTATTDNYAITDVIVCEGINNLNCAESVSILDWNVDAHGHYFQLIAACDPSFSFRV